jgi:hypothetical protein
VVRNDKRRGKMFKKSSETFGSKAGGIQRFVKVKPLYEAAPMKIVTMAGVGLFAGAVYGVLSQIAKLDFKGDAELDPPAPNMSELEPELVLLFRQFMGRYYDICPERNKETYKKYVRRAIRNAEAVMLIACQLIKKEVTAAPVHRNAAAACANLCMEWLRKTQDLFDTEVIKNVSETATVVYTILANHLSNIKLLTSIY